MIALCSCIFTLRKKMNFRVVIMLIALVSLTGCGEEYWSKDIEFEEDEYLHSKTADELAMTRLIRQLPGYYKTIGSPMPSDSMEALLVSAKSAPAPIRSNVKSFVQKTQKGVAKTILHGKAGAVPYSPVHLMMTYAREVYQHVKAKPESFCAEVHLLRSQQLVGLLRSSWQPGGMSRRESEFNRLYRTMTEYFHEDRPRENSRMQAIEFLEKGAFIESYLNSNGDFSGDRLRLIRKLKKAVASGFHNRDKDGKESLHQLIKEFVKLFNELDSEKVCASSATYDEQLKKIFHFLSAKEDLMEKLTL